LPFNEQAGKQIVLVEPAEPVHFYIAGETNTVGAWQYGSVTERSEPMLMLHFVPPRSFGAGQRRNNSTPIGLR
jgi:hypothetical protein